MNKFGPTRKEHRFRLAVSLGGLALMVVALVIRGVPQGPAFVEVVGLASVFFGGSALYSGWVLWKGTAPPE